MDWHFALGITAGLIQLATPVPYIWSMLYGTTRPNIVTQILWVLLAGIEVFAQLSAGASWSVILMMAVVVGAGAVLILAFFGYGHTEIGKIDYICFVLALTAIIGWQVTSNPLVALAISIFASVIACIPAVKKTLKYPDTESLLAWSMVVTASVLAIFSTTKIDFANLVGPIYQLAESLAFFAIIYFGTRKLRVRTAI